jgi:hypothetical protein
MTEHNNSIVIAEADFMILWDHCLSCTDLDENQRAVLRSIHYKVVRYSPKRKPSPQANSRSKRTREIPTTHLRDNEEDSTFPTQEDQLSALQKRRERCSIPHIKTERQIRPLRRITPAPSQGLGTSSFDTAVGQVRSRCKNPSSIQSDRNASLLKRLGEIKTHWKEGQRDLCATREHYHDLIQSFVGEGIAYHTEPDHRQPDEQDTLYTVGLKLAQLKGRKADCNRRERTSYQFNTLLFASYCIFIQGKGIEERAIANIWARANEKEECSALTKGARMLNQCINRIADLEGWDIFQATELFVICKSLIVLLGLHQLIYAKVLSHLLTWSDSVQIPSESYLNRFRGER